MTLYGLEQKFNGFRKLVLIPFLTLGQIKTCEEFLKS